MKAIVLSGPPAVGKTTAAHILSERLGLPVVGGGDILKEMAQDRGYKVNAADWWDTDEGIRFLKEREANSDFDKEADRRLALKIHGGNVIITSYTAPWIARDGFKVWLSGTDKNRAKRMSARDNESVEKCAKVIEIRDKENAKHYKSLYNIDFDIDTKPFDLVIDTNNITAEEVADIIIKKLKE